MVSISYPNFRILDQLLVNSQFPVYEQRKTNTIISADKKRVLARGPFFNCFNMFQQVTHVVYMHVQEVGVNVEPFCPKL